MQWEGCPKPCQLALPTWPPCAERLGFIALGVGRCALMSKSRVQGL